MSELQKRIIVAAIGIPIGIILIYLGGLFFIITIITISSIALWEFYKLAEKRGYPSDWILGLALGTAILTTYYIFNNFGNETSEEIFYGIVTVYLFSFLLVPLYLLFNDKKGHYLARIGVVFTGFFYISLPFFCLVLLRDLDNGFYYTILTFASIWVCDSAAYFIGRKFGKHKLMPSVSPQKSIEGAIAGFIASSIFFVILSNYFIADIPLHLSIVLGIIIGIFGQIGDLIESKFKRDADIKDSSNIIPGHGGVLDRFDSIIFVVPFVFIILILFNS